MSKEKTYRMLVPRKMAKCFHIGTGADKEEVYVEFKNMVKTPTRFIGGTYKTSNKLIQDHLESLDEFGKLYDIDGKQPTKKSVNAEAERIAQEREEFEAEKARFEAEKQEAADKQAAEAKLRDEARDPVKKEEAPKEPEPEKKVLKPEDVKKKTSPPKPDKK